MNEFNRESHDNNGFKIEERYSLILTDVHFEKRLKAFDSNLKLMFDLVDRRWKILERAPDSKWNMILALQDEHGEPKPFGDWIFNKLFVMRHNHAEKKRIGVDQWLNNLRDQAREERNKIQEKTSSESRDMLRDNVLQWRKASRELDKLPVSDVTAGFQYNNKPAFQRRAGVNTYKHTNKGLVLCK